MRIFVASWFFPPMTSSEGIVSYKLLRNSRHQFDVCSSTSGQWSYKQELPLQADNIEVFPVQTDDFETWLDAAYALFTRLHAEEPYDALMTRSMPPESIELAKRVLRSYPELPWIASLADPLAKSPYEIEGRILEASNLSESEKRDFPCALRVGCEGWKDHPVENIRIMVQQKEIEDFAINNATALIFPCDTLKSYVLGTRKRKNAFTVAHSYDRELFAASRGVATETPQAAAKAPQVAAAEAPQAATAAVEDLITLTFTGHTDARRSLDPLVEALELLRKTDEKACERLRFRFIGNILEDTRILIYNYFLNDYISIEPSVDYLTSLTLMQESDWLIHVDTHFDFLEKTGGSIFFAGKLADYMGTDKPILALTGTHSPADGIVRRAGGACFAACDISGLAQALSDIASGALAPKIDRGYRNGFDAVNVAREHDRLLEGLLNAADTPFTREFWPEVPNLGSAQAKFLSICIPAYKVESYLDRCLFSLLSSRVADLLEVLVINDGSPDNSRAIALAYQEHYPTIVRLIDKENGGHGSTINTALEHATGTYFRIIDGDDWVDSINLTTMLEKLQETEPEADLVSTNYHQVYSDDGHTVPWMKVGNWEDYVALDFAEQGFEQEYFTMASTMIKTALLQQA
ncbi:MAG: glycosyltransferase, partial [Coriobacteriales bacterium]|nr:glycosyltransferase [Coriobacteriales bacterium]